MSCVLDEPGVSSETRFEFVGDSPPRRAFEALALLDAAAIESMDRDDLDSVMQARRALAAFADGVDIRVARRSRQLAAEGRSESASGVLRDCGRRSGRDAAAAAGREQACEQLPSNGQRAFLEVKTGAGAVPNPNQLGAFPEIITGGGTPVGANAARAGLDAGVEIGPTQVWIVHQPWPLPPP